MEYLSGKECEIIYMLTQQILKLETADIPADIQALADARTAAKSARDWARADELRAQIDAAGWNIIDTKDGAKIVKKA